MIKKQTSMLKQLKQISFCFYYSKTIHTLSKISLILCFHKFQIECNGSKEKQLILALGACINQHMGHWFIYPGQNKTEMMVFKMTSHNIRSAECQASTEWLNVSL